MTKMGVAIQEENKKKRKIEESETNEAIDKSPKREKKR
jgi:hypothetical protein